ncbi:hypothetical protein BKA61DRAFT_598669 [Leptodontidium sp. MPI-SDFR-AT-0119]|nr:hypothetical protein BKA61DRAFT_598669 [Leptodontidium sp. MPI-SDFR-AT-0119]
MPLPWLLVPLLDLFLGRYLGFAKLWKSMIHRFITTKRGVKQSPICRNLFKLTKKPNIPPAHSKFSPFTAPQKQGTLVITCTH